MAQTERLRGMKIDPAILTRLERLARESRGCRWTKPEAWKHSPSMVDAREALPNHPRAERVKTPAVRDLR